MSLRDHPVVQAQLRDLPRLVVVGGTSVGKTTLVNHWRGGNEPVGMGGLTQSAVVHSQSDCILIDTPSLDQQPDLYPWATGCDVLVWVIDGLRPIGHIERQAVEQLGTVSGSTMGLVSRSDLLAPADRKAVQARCERLCPGPVQLVDLRTQPPALPAVDRMVTRRTAILHAVAQRIEQLEAALECIEAWRTLCRSTPESESSSAIAHLEQRIVSMAQHLGWDTPPALPAPPNHPTTTGWRDMLGGPTRRHRQQVASAASWFRDGHVRLLDWLAPLGDERSMRAELEQVRRNRVEQYPGHATPRP